MFNLIRTDEDRALYLKELEKVEEVINRQSELKGQEKVNGIILEKLNKLRDFILNEIKKYDE